MTSELHDMSPWGWIAILAILLMYYSLTSKEIPETMNESDFTLGDIYETRIKNGVTYRYDAPRFEVEWTDSSTRIIRSFKRAEDAIKLFNQLTK